MGKAFANFYYHSAASHVLAQCGRTDEIRISTDMLLVNPNKGFNWHQDNQNGPLSWEEGLRFWISMDQTPKEYGAPVYLKGSHMNNAVSEEAVFVDIEMEGPSDGIWTSFRRVLGGTAAKGRATYNDKTGSGGVLSDLGNHGLVQGDKIDSPFFPIIYPQFDKAEAAARDNGEVARSPKDMVSKIGGMVGKTSSEKFFSFFKVLENR